MQQNFQFFIKNDISLSLVRDMQIKATTLHDEENFNLFLWSLAKFFFCIATMIIALVHVLHWMQDNRQKGIV